MTNLRYYALDNRRAAFRILMDGIGAIPVSSGTTEADAPSAAGLRFSSSEGEALARVLAERRERPSSCAPKGRNRESDVYIISIRPNGDIKKMKRVSFSTVYREGGD